ncbi:MAG TPA: hypothetical protein VGN52_12960 [Burkholderiales bacterium]
MPIKPLSSPATKKENIMRSIILWLLGVPISLIIIIGLFSHF